MTSTFTDALRNFFLRQAAEYEASGLEPDKALTLAADDVMRMLRGSRMELVAMLIEIAMPEPVVEKAPPSDTTVH